MILAILAVTAALSPFAHALSLDGPPEQSGGLALAPLISGNVSYHEPAQPTQSDPSSMAGFDAHLATEDLSDLDRLTHLSTFIANGGAPARTELAWARARLKQAISRGNVAQARKKLMEDIRSQGLIDTFSGEQLLPANAPDSRIAPYVEMKIRGAREAARELLEEINTVAAH